MHEINPPCSLGTQGEIQITEIWSTKRFEATLIFQLDCNIFNGKNKQMKSTNFKIRFETDHAHNEKSRLHKK